MHPLPGRQWLQVAALPSDFPPWKTVYGFLTRWAGAGVLERIRDQLRRRVRIAARLEGGATMVIYKPDRVGPLHEGAARLHRGPVARPWRRGGDLDRGVRRRAPDRRRRTG